MTLPYRRASFLFSKSGCHSSLGMDHLVHKPLVVMVQSSPRQSLTVDKVLNLSLPGEIWQNYPPNFSHAQIWKMRLSDHQQAKF